MRNDGKVCQVGTYFSSSRSGILYELQGRSREAISAADVTGGRGVTDGAIPSNPFLPPPLYNDVYRSVG